MHTPATAPPPAPAASNRTRPAWLAIAILAAGCSGTPAEPPVAAAIGPSTAGSCSD